MLLSNEGSASGLLLLKSIYTEDYSTFHPTPSLDLVQNHQRTAASLLLESSFLVDQLKPAHASPLSSSSASSIVTPTAGNSASDIRPAQPCLEVLAASTNQHRQALARFDAASMSGSYFPFESSSLPHLPEHATTYSDSPAMNEQSPFQKSGAISPGTSFANHQQQWSNDGQTEQDNRLQSPAQSTYQAPYSLSKDSSHQTSPVALHSQGHDTSASHYLHRASISGPVMDSLSYHTAHADQMAAPAPPRVHGLAAWENASGSARPHTADGLFGHFGFTHAAHSHDGSVEGATLPPSMGPTSRPYTPAGPSASVDPYFQQRRFSLPDPDAVGNSGNASKIFSYMPPLDDGAMGTSSNMGGAGYSGHYFGNMNGFHSGSSKKRPRRRYDEIERLYACSWSGCNKSYGTLNHLNAHVAMQKHGPKRAPTEFKDMRKAWRKQKKDEEQRRQGRHGPLVDTASGRSDLARPATSSAYVHSIAAGPNELASTAIVRPPNVGAFGSSIAPASSGIADLAHHTNFGAELSKYSMSSVAENAVPSSQPFFLHGSYAHQQPHPQQHFTAGNSSNIVPNVHGQDLADLTSGVPDSRHNTAAGPGVMGAQLYQHPNFAGYLAAHRGSI